MPTMRERRMGKSLYIWIRTFTIILTLLSGLLIIFTNWMVASFSNEIIKLNHNLTSNIQSGMDIRLNDIDLFTAQLQMNSTNLFLSKAADIGEVDDQKLFQLSRQLNDYKMSNNFIQSFYIYYPNIDYVVGDLGYFPSQMYFLLSNQLSYLGYEAWLETINTNRSSGFYFEEGTTKDTELYFTRSQPFIEQKKAVMVITINKEEVWQMLKNDKFALDNSLNAVISDDGLVYTYSGNTDKLKWIDEFVETNNGTDYVNNRDYFGSVQNSDFYQIRYVSLNDRRQVLKTSYFIRNMTHIFLIISMLGGLLLFFVMGKRNIRPIRKILEKLQYTTGTSGKHLVDDYELIGSGIDAIIANDQAVRGKLEEQQNATEGLFLYNLLNSEERNNVMIFASMQRYNLQLEYSLFQVMLLRNSRGFAPDEIKPLIREIIGQVKSESKEIYVLATEFKGDIVLLFHMEPDFGENYIQKIAEHILSLQSLNGENILLFAGDMYDTMSNIITSYHQARLLAEGEAAGKQRLSFFDERKTAEKKKEKQGSDMMPEYELAMLEENYENARKQIDLLFNQYIGMERNVFTARARKYAVMNPLMEAVGKMAELDKAKEELVRRLSEAKDNQRLLEVMHEIFSLLIANQKKEQADRKEGLLQQARNYIDQNFEDPMIGLYSISEVLGISNTYLSTVFKKNYGLGVVQYINQLRIDKAKMLILNTEYSIKEIALSVGFTSDVTFNRVFKQFEHTTPGRYKKEGSGEKL